MIVPPHHISRRSSQIPATWIELEYPFLCLNVSEENVTLLATSIYVRCNLTHTGECSNVSLCLRICGENDT
jgi:hypothetical protein